MRRSVRLGNVALTVLIGVTAYACAAAGTFQTNAPATAGQSFGSAPTQPSAMPVPSASTSAEGLASSSPGSTATAILGGSMPPGITRDQAIALAQESVTEDAHYTTAIAGPYGALRPLLHIDGGPFYDEPDPDHWMWAVEYDTTFTICDGPIPSDCPPRNGVVVVLLEFSDGTFWRTYAWAGPPSTEP